MPTESSAGSGSRRPDLQGMRAVAVLAVFADHLFGWPSGGFVGVDVFFVLSGFFITGLLIREITNTKKLSFEHFYVRRAKRILPSAVLVLIVTMIGSYLLLPAIRAKETLVDALYAAVFVSNFRFEAVGADYFQQDQPPSPLQHYWSLSIEEQFYFVWPALLVLLFALIRMRKRRDGANNRNLRLGLFVAMAGVVTASFVWAMALSATDPNAAYFSTITRLWELGVGALLAISGPWLARIPSAVRPTLAYLGVTGVLGSLVVIDSTVQFPAPWAALPVLSTALVVASFHGVEVRGMSPLTNRVAGYFGDTSYTLYLWHWPVIVLLQAVIPKGLLFYGVALALALGLTAVTYRFYENPIRKSNWLLETSAYRGRRIPSLSRSGWAFVGGLGAAAITVSILWIGYSEKVETARELSAEEGRRASQSTSDSENIDPCFGAPAMLNRNCVLWNPELPLQPSVDSFSKDLPPEMTRCQGRADAELISCDFGHAGDDAKRIALVGDSHATTLIPALQQLLSQNKWRLTTYVGHSCAFSDPVPKGSKCREAMIKTKEELLAKRYDLVIFSNRNKNYSNYENSFQSAYAQIAAAGSRIAVMADNPASSDEAVACLTRADLVGGQIGDCGTPRVEALPYPDPMVGAAQRVPGATIIDLTRYYCTDDRCPSVIGNAIVYTDNNHITATFSETLAPALEDGLRLALGDSLPGAR